MNIRFPFLYTAHYQADGRRDMAEPRAIRGDWAEIEIRDCRGEDAPLVCQVEGFGMGGIPYLIEVRKVGGRYFRPKLVVSNHSYAPLEDGSDRLAAPELGQAVPLAMSHHIRERVDNAQRPIHSEDRYHEILGIIDNQPGDRVVVSDDRAEVLAAHERAAQQLVVIDGMVWEQCLEPRLTIDITAALPRAIVTVAKPESPPAGKVQTFPLTMADRIHDMLAEALLDPDFQTYPAAPNPRPNWKIDEVELPNVVYYDPSLGRVPWKEVYEVARGVFSALPGTHFEHYSREYIVAWVDFRDALRLAGAEPTSASVGRVIEAWQTASDSADAESEARRGAARTFETAAARIVRHHTLAAWRDLLENRMPTNGAARALGNPTGPPSVMADENDPEKAHRVAMEETYFWGRRGAGAIVFAKSTGRYLLQLRSEEVEQPGTWGVWGGAIDEGHEAEDCVIAELEQETGYRGTTSLYFIVDYVDPPSGFRYSNFIAVVGDEFDPVLNWEGSDFGWFESGEWPEPMHFGLRFLLDQAPVPAELVPPDGPTTKRSGPGR